MQSTSKKLGHVESGAGEEIPQAKLLLSDELPTFTH